MILVDNLGYCHDPLFARRSYHVPYLTRLGCSSSLFLFYLSEEAANKDFALS